MLLQMKDLSPSSFFTKREQKYFETWPCLSLLTQGHHINLYHKKQANNSTHKENSIRREKKKKEIKKKLKEKQCGYPLLAYAKPASSS